MVGATLKLDVSNDDLQGKRRDLDPELSKIWALLDKVKDPEIPVLSIAELGVLRDVEKVDNKLRVTITPTYSGCPAMDMIRQDIKNVLSDSGYRNSKILTILSPAWTTDWMTEEAREKLQNFGIAPPSHTNSSCHSVSCPRCRSENTTLISEFGSTACKSMYRCQQCEETFCYFKAI